MANFVNLLTRKQVRWVYGVFDALPAKGKPALDFPLSKSTTHKVRISRCETNSTYDEALYRCEHIPLNLNLFET